MPLGARGSTPQTSEPPVSFRGEPQLPAIGEHERVSHTTAPLDSRAHLADAERRLAWTRRAALIGWGLILYWREGAFSLNAAWLVYALGLAYMAGLHWYIRRRTVTRTTSWVATVSDSLLTHLMCQISGGPASPLLPFFYFTTLAGAFRFGAEEITRILLLNGGLLIALHLPGRQPVVSELMLSLYYLGFAAALGAMLAGWARANLDIALARSAALEVERDRSTVLLQRLIRAEEDERKRLAEDLHDRMGAGLFYLQHALDEFVQRTRGDPQGVRQVESMQRELAKCSADVRTLMNDLRPTVLDHFGLCEALSEYLTSLVGSVPFAIETRFDPQLQGWRSRQDVTLFRLMQEALLNVRKHAQATRVEVSLGLSDGNVVLSVRDNGCGFDPGSVPSGHLGLLMMRERAQAASGTLEIDTSAGSGTTVRLKFPQEQTSAA
jgi:two-component system NarL family sensor kinase